MASREGENKVLLDAVFAHFAARVISQNEYFRKPPLATVFGHCLRSRVWRRKYSTSGTLSLTSKVCASFSQHRNNVLVWRNVIGVEGAVFRSGDAMVQA